MPIVTNVFIYSSKFVSLMVLFDVYQDGDGNDVWYLSLLSYHVTNGKKKVGESIAPLFDKISDQVEEEEYPILMYAIVCGIKDGGDIQ